jgi:hypothetical protein
MAEMQGAVPMDWMLLPYKRYTDFSGRSQRKEYWMFGLMVAVVRLIDGDVRIGDLFHAGGVSHHAQRDGQPAGRDLHFHA